MLLVAAAWLVTWPDPRPGDTVALSSKAPLALGLLPSCSPPETGTPLFLPSFLPSLSHTFCVCPCIASCPSSVCSGLSGPGAPSLVFCLLICPGPYRPWGVSWASSLWAVPGLPKCPSVPRLWASGLCGSLGPLLLQA